MRNIANLPNDNTARQYTFHEHAEIAYGAAITLPAMKTVNEQDVYIAELTGALTLNADAATIANLVKGDRVNINVTTDGTARTITWGTNILAPTATRAIIANGGAVIPMIYNGAALVVAIS